MEGVVKEGLSDEATFESRPKENESKITEVSGRTPDVLSYRIHVFQNREMIHLLYYHKPYFS